MYVITSYTYQSNFRALACNHIADSEIKLVQVQLKGLWTKRDPNAIFFPPKKDQLSIHPYNPCRIWPKDSFAWHLHEISTDIMFCWIIIYILTHFKTSPQITSQDSKEKERKELMLVHWRWTSIWSNTFLNLSSKSRNFSKKKKE